MYNENPDIYVATRDSVGDPWTDPQSIGPAVNTQFGEASPSISPDGRELYFSDGHREGYPEPLRPGGLGGPDNWVSFWDEENGSWGEPQNLGAPLNSPYHDFKADLSHDGLEFYFSSDRPGGAGVTDIWMARRPTINDPWGDPINLGPVVNGSSHDENPTVSPDGRMLFFSSNRPGGRGGPMDLWLSTRKGTEDEWGPPVHLGNKVNGTYWTTEPEVSPNGATLMYSRWDPGPGGTLWQVPLLPLEAVPLEPGSGPYAQDFDEALSVDGTKGQTLPTGWTITSSGVVFENETTADFPLSASESLPRKVASIYNAGADDDMDRTLAVGVAPSTDPATIQFMSEIGESDALSFQLLFDLEVWDAERFARDPGEAAFDVSVEVEPRDGATIAREFGTVTTGNGLSLPKAGYLDGNSEANRVSFDSGIVPMHIPAGSQMRILWKANTSAESTGWIYGLDNVSLSLFRTGTFKSGDFDKSGLLDVADMDALTAEVVLGRQLPEFDLNNDGKVDESDRRIWITEIKNTYFGDTNLDGEVNAADLNVVALNWRSEMATSWSQGDFNGDGKVDALDLNSLALNWRSGTFAASSAQSIPEPSSAALLLLASLAVVCRLRGIVGYSRSRKRVSAFTAPASE